MSDVTEPYGTGALLCAVKGLVALSAWVWAGWLSLSVAAFLALLAPFVGALWEGAKPEVTSFGGDVAASILDAARRILRIRPRDSRHRTFL